MILLLVIGLLTLIILQMHLIGLEIIMVGVIMRETMEFKESETIELKTSTAELEEAIIAICAILNKHRKGELYFGIKNNGIIIGQDVSDKTLRDISKTISDNIEPKIFPIVKEVEIDGRKCVYVKFEGNEIPYFANGRAYVRVGTENKQVSAQELKNLIKRENKDRWDLNICKDARISDIDPETINKFLKLVGESKRISIEKEEIDLILRKLELIKNDKLTNAAILLFGKNPSRFFNNSMVKCGRFRGVTKEEFIDMKDFEGNLFECLEKSIDFIKNHLKLSAKIKGLLRKEKWEIPIEALREAIINALIHRDYFSTGFVYIKIYDPEIVIANPGKLP